MLRRVPLVSLLVASFFFGVRAEDSQELAGLKELQIAFWPEFDRPDMLVIYRAKLPDGITLPASVTLPIPASVGEPLAAAWRDAKGSLLNAHFTRTLEGEWAMIRVEAESPEIQLEYYQPLTVEGDRHSFVFEWPGGLLIEALGYEVQQPPLASEFEISPPATEQRLSEQDQLSYYFADLGRVKVSEKVTIQIAYRNPTESLTSEILESASPLSPVEPASRATPNLIAYLPWVAGVMGLVLVAVAAFVYLRANRHEARVAARRRHPPFRGQGEPGEALDAGAVFCHNCGTRASVSDQFCRQCGTRLRH